MFKPLSGRLLAVVLGACLCAPAAIPQTPATGPWAKVPALSTACYSGTDPFVARLDAALTAVNADRARQQAINDKIAEAHKNMDQMEQMQRMQQWMMDNPQAATKYMQRVQALGTEEGQASVMESLNTQTRFDNEKKDLIKRYHAGLAQAYAPADARWKALLKKVGVDESTPTVKDSGTPDWAMVEEDAIYRARDQAYAAHCPQWWTAAGPAQTWLKKYRTWLVQEHIPYQESLEALGMQTYEMMNTPAASYRSLATLDGVIKYLEAVAAVYAERMEKPECTATSCGFGS